jgi:hypothetical protein
VYGSNRWEDALEELLSACYAFIFVDRKRSLLAQLVVKPNVNGLVVLNIRHFLHDRQKEHDPLGAQVFEVLQLAVRRAVEEGTLHVLSGDERVRNATLLGFRPDADPGEPSRVDLRALVARWNDELLPDLVTLRGRHQEKVVQRLRLRLGDLAREGVQGFRFKDLVDPLKADVRARWSALLEGAQGDVAKERTPEGRPRLIPVTQPDTMMEDRQHFRRLVACVLEALERSDANERTRRYLSTLWQFLRARAAGSPTPAASLDVEDEAQLSYRELSERLAIPRERFPDLFRALGRLVQRCSAANSADRAVISLAERSARKQGSPHAS